MKRTRLLSLVLLLLFSAIWGNWLFAQISEGGLPPSFSYPDQLENLMTKKPYVASINFDVKKLRAQDKQMEDMNTPLRTSVIIPADLNINNSGNWVTLPDGQHVCRLEISAPKAIALMLYYDEFYIPEGGKLFIYNAAKNHVIGAYTSKTNPNQKFFATEFVAGDNIILEYVSPIKQQGDNAYFTKAEMPRIEITGIGYGYNYINVTTLNGIPYDQLDRFNDPGNWCMININCPEGNDWQDQKKGVAKTLTPISGYTWMCSGTVINNTAQDLTPYFLTASHCFYDDSNVKCSQWDQIVYYFHYEQPGCDNLAAEPVSKTMTGAQLLVELPIENGSDGALLKLNQDIPLDYNVYYNGWDRTNTPATSGVGIHHPGGDVKKISTYLTPATHITWNNGQGAANGHWNVTWAATQSGKSLMDKGSSGSPLFNQDKRVIGSLTGGPSTGNTPKCDQPASTHVGYYGKLWYHWDNNNIVDPSTTMATYLDPVNSGVETIDGTYVQNQNPQANFGASSTDIYVFQTIKYTDYSSKATSFEWTFEGGTPNSSTEKNPPIITYNELGTFKTKLIINKGTADESEKEITITVTEKGTDPVEPKAIFSITDPQVLMQEGFDVPAAANFPPTGWTVEKPGASSQQWKAGNPNSSNFNTIDENSTYSAVIAYDDNSIVDTWLKSDIISVPEHATLEFYAGYSGSWLSGGYMTLYASTDGGITWSDKLWTNGTDDIPGLAWTWTQQKVDLSAYVGKDVRFAWQYYGQGGDLAGIDGVNISAYEPDVKMNINVGDYINIKDLSSGPPILYEWTFEGGDPEVSDKEVPDRIRYMTPGTYDIKLKVKNYRGEDEHIFTDAVTVTDLIPVADYSVSSGYTRQSNSGLFIPDNTTVDFMGHSSNYPTKWEWKFGGGVPATSTEQNPEAVKFNVAGQYDFSFKAENSAGAGEISIEKGINVGYNRDNIWNMKYGEANNIYYTYDYGYVTGTNGYYHDSFAERFDAPPVTSAITSVDIAFYVEDIGTGSFTIDIMSESTNGKPGNVIASVSLPVSSINPSGYTTVTFSEPVIVNGAFYVASWYWDGTGGNTFKGAILTSETRGNGAKNTAYAYNWINGYFGGEGWTGLNEVFNNFAVSMNIVPRLTYVNHEGVDIKKFNKKNIDKEVNTVNVKSNIPWKATTDAPWIDIVDGAKDGNGSFTFTVNDNNYNARRAFIQVSAGQAYSDYILVQQAGPNPTELSAGIIDEPNGEIALKWQVDVKKPYQLGDNIFDDIEMHPSFALDSPGEYGWSYIDGDGGTPYRIEADDYPNWGIPSSFIVYNPNKTIPQITDAIFSPKSGKQYFACPRNNNDAIPNNDWLVSPELKYPSEFTFSFWAKSISANFALERIKVAYSTTGKNQADFTNIVTTGNYVQVPATWTKYQFTIPTDAKYVAINCVSSLAFMLAVDDIFIGVGDVPQSKYELENINESNGTATFRMTDRNTDNRINKGANYSKAELQTMFDEKKAKTNTPLQFTNGRTGETLEVKFTPIEASKEKASGKFEKEGTNKVLQPETLKYNNLESDSELPVTKLRYDDGINNEGIYFNIDGEFAIETAVRFTPADLLNYQGAKMKAVDVFVRNVPSDGIILNIRQGEKVVHSQNVQAITANKWTRINLTNEIAIEASEDMYVGYKFMQRDKMVVAGCDAGPGVAMKGDLIAVEDDPFMSLSTAGMSVNWNLALLVEDKKDMIDMVYTVYRDGEVIATTKDAVYTDQIITDKACYEVTATYNGELESTTSNNACVTLSALPKPKAITDLTAIVTDLVDVELAWAENESAVSYSVYRDGELLDNVEDAVYTDENLIPGNYCYTVTVVNSADTESDISNEACITIEKSSNTESTVAVTGTTYDASKEIYVVDCDATSLNIEVTAEDEFAKVVIDNVERSNLTLDVTKPNFYTVNYSVISHDGSQIDNHKLTIEKRFDFNSVVITRWNNTLIVLNNPENNGGYRFTSYKWFRNGEAIGSGQSFSAGKDGEQLNATDKYYVELTSDQFAGTLRTCEGTPVLKSASVKVYPNPVKANETVFVEADVDEELLEGAHIEIYNISGTLVEKVKVQGRLTPVNIKSSTAGTYVFVLKGKDGFSQNLKVVVNKGQQ